MRFEKINENKLKITLSGDELPNSDTLDNFMVDSSYARDSFLQLLDEANNAVGFRTKDYKIKIDARALSNGNFVFIVTKLMQLKKTRIAVHPKKIIKDSEITSPYLVYLFNSFDDFCNFCAYLKQNKINCLKTLSKSCELYRYANQYYLVFNKINEKYKYISRLYCCITEFSKFFSSKELFVSTLQEHGEMLIGNNSLITGQKFFSK